MSSRKIKVESMSNLTVNSLVRLATVVFVPIQYPHKKIRITKSCGEEKKLTIVCYFDVKCYAPLHRCFDNSEVEALKNFSNKKL
jgi:hypothetical protein